MRYFEPLRNMGLQPNGGIPASPTYAYGRGRRYLRAISLETPHLAAYTLVMKIWTLCAAALLAASSTVHAATLFDQLGREAKLRPAVDELVNIMLDDDRINFVFAETDLTKFKGFLYDQLCQLSGGPCIYKGRDMFTAHQKLKVKNAQFNALTEDLYRAMGRVGIAYRAQNKLVAKLAPMQRDIVK